MEDRIPINRIATRIIELDPDREGGMVDCYLEDYDDAFAEYLRLRERVEAASAPKVEKPTKDAREIYEQKKREDARARQEARRIERAKARIPEIEAKLEELEEELFGDAASDYVRAAEIEKEKEKLEEELMELYELTID